MAKYETPASFSEEDVTGSVIDDLNDLMLVGQTQLSWVSSDGVRHYFAAPLTDLISGETCWGAWRLIAAEDPDVNGDVALADYQVIAWEPLHVTHHQIIASELGERTVLEVADEDSKLQVRLGMERATLTDYAYLDNAIFDLHPIARKALSDYIHETAMWKQAGLDLWRAE